MLGGFASTDMGVPQCRAVSSALLMSAERLLNLECFPRLQDLGSGLMVPFLGEWHGRRWCLARVNPGELVCSANSSRISFSTFICNLTRVQAIKFPL